jgi:hypothetical protein
LPKDRASDQTTFGKLPSKCGHVPRILHKHPRSPER